MAPAAGTTDTQQTAANDSASGEAASASPSESSQFIQNFSASMIAAGIDSAVVAKVEAGVDSELNHANLSDGAESGLAHILRLELKYVKKFADISDQSKALRALANTASGASDKNISQFSTVAAELSGYSATIVSDFIGMLTTGIPIANTKDFVDRFGKELVSEASPAAASTLTAALAGAREGLGDSFSSVVKSVAAVVSTLKPTAAADGDKIAAADPSKITPEKPAVIANSFAVGDDHFQFTVPSADCENAAPVVTPSPQTPATNSPDPQTPASPLPPPGAIVATTGLSLAGAIVRVCPQPMGGGPGRPAAPIPLPLPKNPGLCPNGDAPITVIAEMTCANPIRPGLATGETHALAYGWSAIQNCGSTVAQEMAKAVANANANAAAQMAGSCNFALAMGSVCDPYGIIPFGLMPPDAGTASCSLHVAVVPGALPGGNPPAW